MRAGLCQSAGLIKYDRVSFCKSFQILSTFNQNFPVRGLPHGRYHTDRRTQLNGTGIVHHQYRKRLCKISGKSEYKRGSQETERHNGICQFLRSGLNPRLHCFRLIDHINDLIDPGVGSKSTDGHNNRTFLHYSTCVHSSAFSSENRKGFSGHGGFIDHGLSFCHSTVKRNKRTGPYPDPVSYRDFFHRTGNLVSIPVTQPYRINIYRQTLGQCAPHPPVRIIF